MKKKAIAVILAVVLLFGVGVGWKWYRLSHIVIGMQPLQIMVDGNKYLHNGAFIEERPDGPPDGTIGKVNEKTDYPDADGEANFGSVGMPYWHTGSKIVVESNRSYYVFRKLEYQE